MSVIAEVLIQVKVRTGDYSDALYFTPEEWAAGPDVEAMAKERQEKHASSVVEQSTPKSDEEIKALVNDELQRISVIREELDVREKELLAVKNG